MNKQEEYNKIPVVYCKNCLSLKVMSLSVDMDFCDECGSTEMGQCTIDDWESKYELKYNKSFIYGKDNGRD